MPKPNFNITLPESYIDKSSFGRLSAQMQEAIASEPAKLNALIDQARNHPDLAPDTQETAQLIDQAIRSSRGAGKTALTELPHFDPNARVQNRSLLSLAAEAKDRSFCMDLLVKGANPCDVEEDVVQVSGFYDVLNTAKRIHAMALKPLSRDGLRPIEHKLANYELDAARTMLESWAKCKLTESNMYHLWKRACEEKRSDVSCALLAFAEKDWIDDLYATTDQYGRSWLHQYGLTLDHPALDRILKKIPYYSEHFEPTESANCEVNFRDSEKQIACNAIAPFAAHQITRFKQAKAERRRALKVDGIAMVAQNQGNVKTADRSIREMTRFDASMFSKEKLPDHIPLNMQGAFNKLLRCAPEADFVPFANWTSFRSGMFRSLDAEKAWKKDEELRIKSTAITGNNKLGETGHVLTEIYIISQDANGEKKYVYLFHDPNAAFPWKRVAAKNLIEVDNWKSESLLIAPEDAETYQLTRGMIISVYPEKAMATLIQGQSIDPLFSAERRISNLPAGNEMISLLGLVLTGGFEGSWQDMQPVLRNYVRGLPESEIFELLGGSNNPKMHNMFMTLAQEDGDSDSAISYLRGLEDMPIPDTLKLQLIKHNRRLYDDPDAKTYPGLIAANANITQAACEFVEKLDIPDPDKLSLIYQKGQGALWGDDPPEKARAIFDFVNRLGIPVEEKLELLLAGSPEEGLPWSFPLLTRANAEITAIILNTFLHSLPVGDRAKLDVLCGELPRQQQQKPEDAELSDDALSISDDADSTDKGVESAVILEGIPESHAGKAKIVIDFISKLNISAEEKAEGLMRYDDELEIASPLTNYLEQGKTSLVSEFVNAVLEITISADPTEDRDKKTEVLLARDQDDIAGIIHALGKGHIGTALQYRNAVRQSSSLVKEHPNMVSVLEAIDEKANLAARGKRRASPTALPGEVRAAPPSSSSRKAA